MIVSLDFKTFLSVTSVTQKYLCVVMKKINVSDGTFHVESVMPIKYEI